MQAEKLEDGRKKRTNQQNRALHLFCLQLADHLNDAGLDQRIILIGSKEKLKSTIITVYLRNKVEFSEDFINDLVEAIYDIPKAEVPWSMMAVKERLWKPIQKVMTEKESTTQMNTVDPGEIHQVLMKHLGERFGLSYLPWPSYL